MIGVRSVGAALAANVNNSRLKPLLRVIENFCARCSKNILLFTYRIDLRILVIEAEFEAQ